MATWQPQSTSYGGALESVHLTDYGYAHREQMSENAAYLIGGVDRTATQYLSIGLFDTENPVNVQSIQSRVAAIESTLANGGSLPGVAGADHSSYAGSMISAGQQFAAPSYSNAPDLQYGEGFTPAEVTYADLSSPTWSNAYSDASPSSYAFAPSATPVFLAGAAGLSATHSLGGNFLSAGSTTEHAHDIGGPSLGMAPSHDLPELGTAAKTVFLGESATNSVHLNLSPDVQERLSGISSTFRSYDLAGGASKTSLEQVSMPSVPNMAPKSQEISHSMAM